MAVKNPHRSDLTLPTSRQIANSRTFDGPRELVFDAHTRPEMLKHWLGAAGWSLEVCEIDRVAGGTWRYVWRRSNQETMENRRLYRKVAAPKRLVSTEAYTDCDAGAKARGQTLSTTVFLEDGPSTTVAMTMQYPSQGVRDGMLASGMEHGLTQSYERLDEYLLSLSRDGRLSNNWRCQS